jgi:hypothetical protein
VFLCHSGADKAAVVAPVALQLEALGLRCFYDQKSVPAGENNNVGIIQKGLLGSRVVVSFVSAHFFDHVRSKYPQQETLTAFANNIPVVPVLLGVQVGQLSSQGLLVAGVSSNKSVRLGKMIKERACIVQDAEFQRTSRAMMVQRIVCDLCDRLRRPIPDVDWARLDEAAQRFYMDAHAQSVILSCSVFDGAVQRLRVHVSHFSVKEISLVHYCIDGRVWCSYGMVYAV